MGRRVALLLVAAAALAAVHTHLSSAAFTAAPRAAGVTISADQLASHFSVTPGAAVQPGTATPIAGGDVNTLALAFGTVPSAQTFAAVFTVKNVSAQTQTAQLTASGVPQIAAAVFASSGGASATLAAGASTTVTVTTSTTVAGRATGALRLGVAGLSWLYRDYALTIAEAPEKPATLTATAQAAGQIHLAWAASSTITNLAGYAVYRSTGGGAYARLNASAVVGSTYDDTATADGTTYAYRVEALSSDASQLASLDSPTATATADASVAISVTYVDNKNPALDQVIVTAEAGATVSGSVSGNAFAGTGSFTATVGSQKTGSGTGTATATDAVGNVRAVTFPWVSTH
jgi:hypothetical protein